MSFLITHFPAGSPGKGPENGAISTVSFPERQRFILTPLNGRTDCIKEKLLNFTAAVSTFSRGNMGRPPATDGRKLMVTGFMQISTAHAQHAWKFRRNLPELHWKRWKSMVLSACRRIFQRRLLSQSGQRDGVLLPCALLPNEVFLKKSAKRIGIDLIIRKRDLYYIREDRCFHRKRAGSVFKKSTRYTAF